MKKIFTTLLLMMFGASVFAEAVDYEQIYRDLPVPTHAYVHNIDPGEGFDARNTAWSPYPLFRLTSPIYFKTIAINPGYYLLTPREHEGKWYMLFKEEGYIRYIVPVYEVGNTPRNFYKENLPEVKTTWSQRRHLIFMERRGRRHKKSMRQPMKQNYLEVFDLDNNFISMVVYWGDHKYCMIFRTIEL